MRIRLGGKDFEGTLEEVRTCLMSLENRQLLYRVNTIVADDGTVLYKTRESMCSICGRAVGNRISLLTIEELACMPKVVCRECYLEPIRERGWERQYSG